jgi:hypothetical protein
MNTRDVVFGVLFCLAAYACGFLGGMEHGLRVAAAAAHEQPAEPNAPGQDDPDDDDNFPMEQVVPV